MRHPPKRLKTVGWKIVSQSHTCLRSGGHVSHRYMNGKNRGLRTRFLRFLSALREYRALAFYWIWIVYPCAPYLLSVPSFLALVPSFLATALDLCTTGGKNGTQVKSGRWQLWRTSCKWVQVLASELLFYVTLFTCKAGRITIIVSLGYCRSELFKIGKML